MPFSRWSVASRGLPPRLALAAGAAKRRAPRRRAPARGGHGCWLGSDLSAAAACASGHDAFRPPQRHCHSQLCARRGAPGRAQAPPAAPARLPGRRPKQSPGRARDGDELALPHKAGDEASRPSRRRSRRARCEASGGAQGKSCCLPQRKPGRHLEA